MEREGPVGPSLLPLRGREWVKNSRLWNTLAEPYPVPGEADALFSSALEGVAPDETTARTGRKGGEVMVYCELFSSAVGVGREGRGCI